MIDITKFVPKELVKRAESSNVEQIVKFANK